MHHLSQGYVTVVPVLNCLEHVVVFIMNKNGNDVDVIKTETHKEVQTVIQDV